MEERWAAQQASQDWETARRRAFWAGLLDVIRRRPAELVPLDEVKVRVNVRGITSLGLQQVPLDNIIGSEGRYSDFDRHFLPRQAKLKGRWQNIDVARYREAPLPPVDLYKLGDVYFVKDGNHRVSVARQLGQTEIDAYVTEYVIDVPLDANLSMRDLLITEEYSDFLDWTGLARLRPQQRIKLSVLGGYLELIEHINTHRYYKSIECHCEVNPDDAVTSWYDNVYLPVIEVIRREKILRFFPGRTEADLYTWIMSHRDELRKVAGSDPGPEAAALDYVERFGQKGVRRTVEAAMRVIAETARTVVDSITAPPLELLDFVEWSHIDVNCPDADLRLSDSHDFARLRKHILDHQYYMQREVKREILLEEAVRDWCLTLYTPVVAAIRGQHALAHFAGRTETDLFLWVTEYMFFRKLEGLTLDSPTAVREFVAHYGDGNDGAKRALAALLARTRRVFRDG